MLKKFKSFAYTCFNGAYRYIETLGNLCIFQFFLSAEQQCLTDLRIEFANAVSYAPYNSEKNICSSGDSERIISWFIS